MTMLWKCLLTTLLALLGRVVPAQPKEGQPAVAIGYCGMKAARPPLKYLSFKVTVRNYADQPRWFLFPAALYDKPVGARKNAGIDAIELFSDVPDHKVTVVYFMGTMKLQPEGAGGFKGLLLPARAVISVHGFSIGFWGEPASPVPLRVVVADRVTIDGTEVEQWMGNTLVSAQTAEVKDLGHAGSKIAPDLKELPVEITKSRDLTVEDALAKKCSD